ncbi:hypothetical protein GGS20DRAFT_527618 [Poronia punctata]|nr:hypothetical protein GGS20DRAFT_527618 [Poronia punctata]
MHPWCIWRALLLSCVGTGAMARPNLNEASLAPPVELDQSGLEARPRLADIGTRQIRDQTQEVSTRTSNSRKTTATTPYAVPLTTTFVPPDSCNGGHLTMVAPPAYFIWLNEPVPVPGTTVSDCYPSEFLEYYTTYHSNPTTTGSRVPMMSPLVCPLGWQVVTKTGDYQACCPSGYELTPPMTTLDPKRPAYGGTCYSEWKVSSSAWVDAYGYSSLTGSKLVLASTPGFANYAHVIDGIAMTTTSSNTSSSTSHSSSSHPTPTPTPTLLPVDSSGSKSHSLTGGAIAGIVIGAVAGLALLAIAGFLLSRRRRRIRRGTANDAPPVPPPKDHKGEIDPSGTIRSPAVTELSWESRSPGAFGESHNKPSPQGGGAWEMAAGESHIHELHADERPVEKP